MKKIILYIFAFYYLCSFTYAELQTEVGCSTYWVNWNSCTQCFDWGFMYESRWKTVSDAFNNLWSSQIYFFDDDNHPNYESTVLQSSTTWFTSNSLLNYADNIDWQVYSWRWVHVFEPHSTEELYVTAPSKWIVLNSVNFWADRNLPAYRLKFHADYHVFNWSLWPKVEHTECLFYKPAWCWDWVVDADQGEQCDDWNTNNWDGCNTSCQVVEPDTYDLALTKELVWTQTRFTNWDIVSYINMVVFIAI